MDSNKHNRSRDSATNLTKKFKKEKINLKELN